MIAMAGSIGIRNRVCLIVITRLKNKSGNTAQVSIKFLSFILFTKNRGAAVKKRSEKKGRKEVWKRAAG
jgi:hypothetical protein